MVAGWRAGLELPAVPKIDPFWDEVVSSSLRL